MPAPLDLHADLVVEHGGREALRLRGDGAVIEATVPNLRAMWLLLSRAAPRGTHRRHALARLAALLAAVDAGVEVRVAAYPVARIGAGARGGALSRVLGLQNVELRPRALLRALLR